MDSILRLFELYVFLLPYSFKANIAYVTTSKAAARGISVLKDSDDKTIEHPQLDGRWK